MVWCGAVYHMMWYRPETGIWCGVRVWTELVRTVYTFYVVTLHRPSQLNQQTLCQDA